LIALPDIERRIESLVTGDPRHADTQRRLRMMVLMSKHLYLFVAGKMQVRGLGDFCCASRPLRQQAEADSARGDLRCPP